MWSPEKPYTDKLFDLIRGTWVTPHVSVSENGLYPIVTKHFDYPETVSVDGIGTKGLYHWQKQTYAAAMLDALAMNLNDLAMNRAQPYRVVDHITLPEARIEALIEMVEVLTTACRSRQIAVLGGETAVHDTIRGLEISITADGFISNPKPNQFVEGDYLIGIASAVLHANGFRTLRRYFHNEFRDEFVRPTPIYADMILALDKEFDVHGMMHITGGAFGKLKIALHPECDIQIWNSHPLLPQDIYHELYDRGITSKKMYSTFNCGVGFILSVGSISDAECIVSEDSRMAIIGQVVRGTGNVRIESAFTEQQEVVL